jgi:hypothetical protein
LGLKQKHPLAISKTNYLYARSQESAEWASYIYSLFAMCKLEGITSKQWLTYTLANIRKQKSIKLKTACQLQLEEKV